MPIERLYLCEKPVDDGTCQRLGGHSGPCSPDARTEFNIEVGGEVAMSGELGLTVIRKAEGHTQETGEHSTGE